MFQASHNKKREKSKKRRSKKKKNKLKKKRIMEVKKVAEKEAAKSEEDARKLVSQRFHKWIHVFRKKVSEKMLTKKL